MGLPGLWTRLTLHFYQVQKEILSVCRTGGLKAEMRETEELETAELGGYWFGDMVSNCQSKA